MADRTLVITSQSQTQLAKEILVKEFIDEEIKLLQNEKFYQYLGKKMQQEFDLLCITQIDNITSQEGFDVSDYRNGFNLKIDGNTIIISNNSVVDLNKTGLSDEQKAVYGEISLASVVEYGIGVIGMRTEITTQIEDGYEYDVNNHGNKGWGYKINGIQYWSRGYEGKLIFYKIAKFIEDNIDTFVEEYLKENMK